MLVLELGSNLRARQKSKDRGRFAHSLPSSERLQLSVARALNGRRSSPELSAVGKDLIGSQDRQPESAAEPRSPRIRPPRLVERTLCSLGRIRPYQRAFPRFTEIRLNSEQVAGYCFRFLVKLLCNIFSCLNKNFD